MATMTVTSTAGLLTALKSAHSGDTIMLAAGTYSAVNIYQYHSPGLVTITSANASNQAVITTINVNQSSGLKFTNLTFATSLYNAPTSSNAAFPFAVYTSQNITFDHVSMHGTLDNNPQDDVNGLRIQGSSNVTVTNSTFQQFYNAITDLSNTNLNISNNSIHDIRNDGIDNGGSSNVVISGNTFTNFHPVGVVGSTGDHADAIQFWTSNTTADVSNITVTNNSVLRGSGSWIQGIFIADQVGVHFNNVTVTGNTILGGEYNGIDIANANTLNVSNNLVEGYTDMMSWIALAADTNVTMNNNVSTGYKLASNTFLSQLYNQTAGLVQAVSTAVVSPVAAVAQTVNLNEFATVSGNALTGDTGSSLYLADVGVGTGVQKLVAAGSTFTGLYGTLTINPNGSYTYAETKQTGLLVGQTYDDHFTVTVAGAGGGAASSTLDFLVHDTGVGNGLVDYIYAGAGAETITGFGAGSVLTSGTGPDTFTFANLASSTPTQQTLIEHFKAGDIIDLSKVDPYFHVVSKFDGHANELVLTHLGTGNWEVYGDTTGSGTANFAVHLLGMSSTYVLGASDFHL